MKKQFCTTLFLALAYFSLLAQPYIWSPVLNGPKSALTNLKILENGDFLAFLPGQRKFTLSTDNGINWNTIDFEFLDYVGLRGYCEIDEKIYFIDQSKMVYELDKDKLEIHLLHEDHSFVSNIIGDQDHLFFMKGLDLFKFNLATLTVEKEFETNDLNWVLHSVENNEILLINKFENKLMILNKNLDIIIPEQNVTFSQFEDLHVLPDKSIYRFKANQLQLSTDLGLSWTAIYEPSNVGTYLFAQHNFVYKENTVSNPQLIVYNFISQQITATYASETDNYFLFNQDILIFQSFEDEHYLIADDGSQTEIITLIDNPYTQSTLACTNQLAAFKIKNNDQYIADNENWSQIPNFIDLHYTVDGNIIGSTNDSLYMSMDKGLTFTPIFGHPIEYGFIEEDRNGDLYIYNELHFLISEDNGFSWEADSRPEYFPEFSLNLESFQYIFPIDEVFFGLSETANVLRLTDNVQSQHASFPWNGNQDYKAFVMNSATDAFVLFIEPVGTVSDTVLMRKLVDEDEEKIEIPIAAYRIEIDKKEVLYIHDENHVYISKDKGDSWKDITGNLPDNVRISELDIANDGTIYLSSSSSDPYKSEFDVYTSTNQPNKEYELPSEVQVVQDFLKLPSFNGNYVIYNNSGTAISVGRTDQQSPGLVNCQAMAPGMYYIQLLSKTNELSIQRFIKI